MKFTLVEAIILASSLAGAAQAGKVACDTKCTLMPCFPVWCKQKGYGVVQWKTTVQKEYFTITVPRTATVTGPGSVKTITVTAPGNNDGPSTVTKISTATVTAPGDGGSVKTITVTAPGDDDSVKTVTVTAPGGGGSVKTITVTAPGGDGETETVTKTVTETGPGGAGGSVKTITVTTGGGDDGDVKTVTKHTTCTRFVTKDGGKTTVTEQGDGKTTTITNVITSTKTSTPQTVTKTVTETVTANPGGKGTDDDDNTGGKDTDDDDNTGGYF
ncbi:hypothetical protein TWF506_006315 [Arthrobotrys conoides]|uniref:Uncharacterized protein n=1 Tax=Arthrobotrys conoides TaxID=74498 RepID=A0AAN8RV41_9PEZI